MNLPHDFYDMQIPEHFTSTDVLVHHRAFSSATLWQWFGGLVGYLNLDESVQLEHMFTHEQVLGRLQDYMSERLFSANDCELAVK